MSQRSKVRYKFRYPKYAKREDWLNRKISDADAKEIKRLYQLGVTLKKISDIFNVSTSCIKRWTLTDDERKRYDRINYLKYKKAYMLAHPEIGVAGHRKQKKRLYKMFPKEFRAWKSERGVKAPCRKTAKFRKYNRNAKKKRYWSDSEYREKAIRRAIDYKRRRKSKRLRNS